MCRLTELHKPRVEFTLRISGTLASNERKTKEDSHTRSIEAQQKMTFDQRAMDAYSDPKMELGLNESAKVGKVPCPILMLVT